MLENSKEAISELLEFCRTEEHLTAKTISLYKKYNFQEKKEKIKLSYK